MSHSFTRLALSMWTCTPPISCGTRLASENSVHIKNVDWDVSHCLEEGGFAPNIKAALLAKRVYVGEIVPFGELHDWNYLSVYGGAPSF